jgi:hypothetical protein
MASTLLLQRDVWDLAVDAAGNIAVASEPYAQVQDVASACRTFAGECYYDTSRGVPYFEQVFSGVTPTPILKARMAAEAKTVPGVASAIVALRPISNRVVTGQVQITLDDGTVQVVGI